MRDTVFAVFWMMAGGVEAACVVNGILAFSHLVDVKGMAITVSKKLMLIGFEEK